MINPLQVVTGFLNWRAHRRQDAAHARAAGERAEMLELLRRQDASRYQFGTSLLQVGTLEQLLGPDPFARQIRRGDPRDSFIFDTATGGGRPMTIPEATNMRSRVVVGGREFRDGDELAEWIENYPVDPAAEAMKLRARTETGRIACTEDISDG